MSCLVPNHVREILRDSTGILSDVGYLRTKKNLPIVIKTIINDFDLATKYQIENEPNALNLETTVDHTLAFDLDGVPIGYLSVMYTKEDQFDKVFPSIEHYIVKNFLFTNIFDMKDVHQFISDIQDGGKTSKEKIKLAEKHSQYVSNLFYAEKYSGEKIDWDLECDKLIQKISNYKSDKNVKREWKDYRERAIMPFPSFVRTDHTLLQNNIAEAMYVQMAKELSKRGLKLYSSTCQVEESPKILWEKMAKSYPEAIRISHKYKDGTLRYEFDGSRIK